MSKTFFAKVKSVLSGDTLVLTNPNNPKAERILSLAYVNAPHLKKEGDEPYAFQSREYLRDLVVGKQIQCTVLYTVPSGRDFGSALLSRDGPSLPDEAIKAGWLKVREDAGRKEESEDILQRLETLRSLEESAKSEGKGVWAGTGGHIQVQNDLGGPEFMNEWKGKTVDGIVERVLSGDRLLVRLLLSDKKHVQVMTLLAGIRSPSTERTQQSTGQVQPAEEFGNEARSFVEERILQRKIKVDIVGASAQGQLVANIIHPNGNKNIAEFLLAEGLARCNDFHSTMLGEKMASLRAAEKTAQGKKIRLHQHHVAKAEGGKSDAVVSKIIGADTIIIRTKTGAEKRINFSSIRGPRTVEASEAPYRDEAKEFLRKRIIAKNVSVAVDGNKPAADGFEAREVATVTEKGKNIGLLLVEEGYATVIRHRKDDTDRASNYDELLAAQEKAKDDKKGIWSGKPPKIKQFVDLSESIQKAKVQLAGLQRQKRIPGVVDFVKSGSRFTVLLPREGVKLTLVLGGIRAPRAPRANGEGGEPFGQEAADLASRRCSQRDCEVDIHDMDKVGGFIGDLYINRESFAKILVEEGLASVHQFSAEKSGNAGILNPAEQAAKEARKGLWQDWDPSQDEEAEAEVPAESNETPESFDNKPKDYRDIVITEMDPNGKLKYQEVGKGTTALATMMNEFRKFNLDSKNSKPLGDSPKTGDYVAAKYSVDGEWYRARIRSNDRAAKIAEVLFIDYGNSEKIPWSNLRPLDQPLFGTQKLKAQASDASLSFVQLPTAPEYFQDATAFIASITGGKELVASFDYVDSRENVNYITLYDYSSGSGKPAANESLNKEVLAAGHGMVPTKLKPWERSAQHASYLKHLKQVEAQAKEERLGMWEYGDITED